MSNIYRTAEVMRLVTSRDDRIQEAWKVFDQILEEAKGWDKEGEEGQNMILAIFVHHVANLIGNVETRCYSQMWDEAHGIPQFDPSIEPKDCFHCKTMVSLRGELCYGHLKHYGMLEDYGLSEGEPDEPDV